MASSRIWIARNQDNDGYGGWFALPRAVDDDLLGLDLRRRRGRRGGGGGGDREKQQQEEEEEEEEEEEDDDAWDEAEREEAYFRALYGAYY